MAKKKLVAHTYAMNDKGRAVWFRPGDTVPDWAAGQLTNPKLYEDTGPDAEEAGPGDTGDTGGTQVGGDPPPRSGRGSGLEAWGSFAQANGVGVDSDMARDDIIAACEAAGVIEREE